MFRLKIIFFSIIAFVFFSFAFDMRNEMNPLKLLSQMNDSIKCIKTLKAKVSSLERIEKKYLSAKSEIKIQSSPRKLYFLNPEKKLEVLYNQGEHNNKALVKPHTFPFVTISLDPTGNLMRKNQHYTVHELGYEFIGRSVALTIAKDGEGLKNFIYHGKIMKNGYNCYFLEYENKSYTYIDYTVKEKETVSSIANNNCVNDYLVRYRNDLLNDFGYLKKGKVIKIPTLYCKKATLYIDEKLLLPVAISLYDDIGIFENYEFTEILINRGIKQEEFTKEYKDYHF